MNELLKALSLSFAAGSTWLLFNERPTRNVIYVGKAKILKTVCDLILPVPMMENITTCE